MYENPDQYPDYFAVFHFNGIGVTVFFVAVILQEQGVACDILTL